jgi:hypothetical protein
MPYYLNVNIDGLISCDSAGDGYSANLRFAKAYPSTGTNALAYNIYMDHDVSPPFSSTIFERFPTFLYIGPNTNTCIVDLIPGDMYHFAVRAFEYDQSFFDITTLPAAYNDMVVLPESLLAADISATDLVIPLIDASLFPNNPNGTVRIGGEIINYSSVDYNNNTLLVPGGGASAVAYLVPQVGGNYYIPASTNTGTGTINNLTLLNLNAPTATWYIKCVSDGYDGIPVFSAVGWRDTSLDDTGSVPAFPADGIVYSNNELSFSITQLTSFIIGDYFIVNVVGANPGMGGGRGYNNTLAREHDTDGYDGYNYWNPNVLFWPIETEETNTRVYECWSRFDINHYPFTLVDGYHQITEDILTTNLTYSDEVNTGFPAYDYAGYHMTDPVLILSGACVGSYIGGYQFCADGYSGVGVQIRGISAQDANLQRQEVLLSTTGEPCCLIKRVWTGITCKCFLPYNEYPESRCPYCYGGGFVVTYEQFFDPRRSDGRIMVRFSPALDDLSSTPDGLESIMIPDCWTLPVPTLKDRDFLVRFDEDGNEEFRYEILNVTRNKLFLDQTGVQKFTLQRVRKTDPIAQVKVFDNTAQFPTVIQTSFAMSLGIPNHQHNIVINESPLITDQITSVSAGHSHVVYRNGTVSYELGHTHTITVPQITFPFAWPPDPFIPVP